MTQAPPQEVAPASNPEEQEVNAVFDEVIAKLTSAAEDVRNKEKEPLNAKPTELVEKAKEKKLSLEQLAELTRQVDYESLAAS